MGTFRLNLHQLARVLIWDMIGAALVLLTGVLCISGIHSLNLQDIDAVNAAYPGPMSYHHEQDRIINGTEAKAGEINSIVSLRSFYGREQGEEPQHKCGGVLLTKSIVLTAAHCCINKTSEYPDQSLKKPHKIREAWGGGLNVKNLAQKKKILKMVVHPKTDGGQIYDLCMLKVQKFKLNKRSKEKRLVKAKIENREVENGEELIVAGWGLTEPLKEGEEMVFKEHLQHLKVKKMSEKTCKKKSRLPKEEGGWSLRQFLYKGTLCTEQEKNTDSCLGDSGGPLYLADTKRRGKDKPKWNFLVGIVSWGQPACGKHEHMPAYSVEVYKFKKWIKNTFKKLK